MPMDAPVAFPATKVELPLVAPTIMLCRHLGINLNEESLMRNMIDFTFDSRRLAMQCLASRLNLIYHSCPTKFSVGRKELSVRTMELDWFSCRFFGYEDQIYAETAYLLSTSLTQNSTFIELVTPLSRARLLGNRLPHHAPMMVALLEVFLCRCVMLRRQLREHLSEFIRVALYCPAYDMASNLHHAVVDACEVDDGE